MVFGNEDAHGGPPENRPRFVAGGVMNERSRGPLFRMRMEV